MRFRPEQHLRRQRDFRAVREEGRRLGCGPFNFAWLLHAPASAPTPAGEIASAPSPALARVGVVASAAAIGNAVQRNRAKRRLRAIFRRHQQLVPAGCDVLLTARSSLNATDYAALEQKFVEACRAISVRGLGKK